MSKHIRWALRDADIPSPTPPGMPSTQTLRLVLIYVADFANDEHNMSCWASVATLAKLTGLSDRQIQKCLAALNELGLIRRGDPQVVADNIRRADHRPNVWELCPDGANVVHPEPVDGVKSGPDGVNHVRERGERGSPDLLREHLLEQERRDEPEQTPKRPRILRSALSEDFQFDMANYAQRSGLPEPVVVAELVKFCIKRGKKRYTPDELDADVLLWLHKAKDYLAKVADRAPNVTNMHGQQVLFTPGPPRPRLTPEEYEAKMAWIDQMGEEHAARQRAIEEANNAKHATPTAAKPDTDESPEGIRRRILLSLATA